MCHVVVIGAGITGVTTAYELSQLGYHVTVVDRHLFPAMGNFFCQMVDNCLHAMRKFGTKIDKC